MSENLPSIQVTPAMAIRFAKHQLKVSRIDAEQWLARNRKEIERRLVEAAQDTIEDVLADVLNLVYQIELRTTMQQTEIG